MPSILPRKRLIRIAQAKQKDIGLWKEGVLLETDSSVEIKELMCRAVSDRWKLAKQHLLHGQKLLTSRPPQNRSAISRYYYSMYHSMRACAYIFHEGDDHKEHSELPKHVPTDFATPGPWSTKLKDARLLRNNADYDVYPKSDNAWRKPALAIKTDADSLLKTAKQYLTYLRHDLPRDSESAVTSAL